MFPRGRTPRRSWDRLWPVLEPLSGQVDRAGLDVFSDVLAVLDDAALDGVDQALHGALRSLDTEAHARAMPTGAWRGPGAPFSVRRFQYARERAVAAGPDALARTTAAPSLLGRFHDPAPGERQRIQVRPDGLTRRIADELLVRGLLDRPRAPLAPVAERRRGWPSLGRSPYAFEPHDPDHVWLQVDSVVGGAWRRAVCAAAGVVVHRLGVTSTAPVTGDPLWTVAIDLAPWGRRPIEVTTESGMVSAYVSVDDDPHRLPAVIAGALRAVVGTWTPDADRTLDGLATAGPVDIPGPPVDGPRSHRPMLVGQRRRDKTRPHEQQTAHEPACNPDPRAAQGLR